MQEWKIVNSSKYTLSCCTYVFHRYRFILAFSVGPYLRFQSHRRTLYQNNSDVCLPVVCLSSVVTRVHCAKRAEPIGTNFGLRVAPDENSTSLKFCDDRLRGWGTVPPK